jgi:hypothetical protein
MKKTVFLVASGDLRLSANRACEEAQAAVGKKIIASLAAEGERVIRAHPYDPEDNLGVFPAHAAEIILTPDGKWHASHAGWGQNGIYLAPLTWAS